MYFYGYSQYQPHAFVQKITLVNKFQLFFLAKTLTTDFYRVWAADSKSVLRFAPSHQVFELFDILYLSMFIC